MTVIIVILFAGGYGRVEQYYNIRIRTKATSALAIVSASQPHFKRWYELVGSRLHPGASAYTRVLGSQHHYEVLIFLGTYWRTVVGVLLRQPWNTALQLLLQTLSYYTARLLQSRGRVGWAASRTNIFVVYLFKSSMSRCFQHFWLNSLFMNQFMPVRDLNPRTGPLVIDHR